jgi:pimeloyl-ACP methyl ester carboxylesterase
LKRPDAFWDKTVARSAFISSRWVFLILLAASGCMGVRHEVLAPVPRCPPRGVIFTADGAGGFEATSAALKESIEAEGLPLCVETVEWSHGFGRVISDQVGRERVHEAGGVLAQRITALRASCPDLAIYLVGHSAGTAVVLEAAGSVPPGTVDRIVLLAPSISADYDLRPALRSVRQNLDVFTSSRDWWYLGVGVSLTGTADGRWATAAAGRVGFRPQVEAAEDAALYQKLQQHPWDPCIAWTGNYGGHYGSHRPEYLRAYVLPLLNCGGSATPVTAPAP